MMIVAVIVSQVTAVLPLLSDYTNATTVTVLGLVLGEISKALSNMLKK